MRIETKYEPWSGIHWRMCMTFPRSGETGVVMLSLIHAQSALLIFLVRALHWILVYLGMSDLLTACRSFLPRFPLSLIFVPGFSSGFLLECAF